MYCYNQISSTFPDDFQLFMNCLILYNSTTNIRFHLAKSGTINIELYDILGREVKEFVNEYKPSGTCEISFDVSGLSIGVYFYRLAAEQFCCTKNLQYFNEHKMFINFIKKQTE